MSTAPQKYPLVDPLMYGLELPQAGLFHPGGFPVKIASNSPLVLQAARESWGAFPARFPVPPLTVRVAVADAPGPLPPAPVFLAQGHLLAIIGDAGNFAVCDYTRRFAFCWTTSAVVADTDYFRYYFLDAAVYTLLSQCNATPVHAACVGAGDTGVLLCGDSGAGKTTLAYACARRGWTFICDDSVMLPWGNPVTTVFGNPLHMRFRSSAAQVSPELASRFAAVRPNGKPAVEIPTAALPGVRTAFEATVRHLVLLDRRESGPAELKPVAAERVLECLTRNVPLFDPPVVERHLEALRALARVQASELCYSGLDEAVEVLECLAQSRKRTSSSHS